MLRWSREHKRGTELKALLDTGAICNVMGKGTHRRLQVTDKAIQINREDQSVLKMYDQSPVITLGSTTILVMEAKGQ